MKKSIFLIALVLFFVVSCSNSPSTPPSGGFKLDPTKNILFQLKDWTGSISEENKALIQAALQGDNQTAVWDSNGLTITDSDDGTVIKISSAWPSDALIDQLPALEGNGEVYCSGYTSSSVGSNASAVVYILWTQAQCEAYGTKLVNAGFTFSGDHQLNDVLYRAYSKGTIGVTLTYSAALSEPFGITVIDNPTP